MLPFNKRSQGRSGNHEESVALPRFPLTSHSVLAYRPQMDSFSDDERTRVMTRSSQPPPLPARAQRQVSSRPPPPPTPKQKAAAAAKAIRCYPPKPSMDEPTASAFQAPPSSRNVIIAPPSIPRPPAIPADMEVTHALGPMGGYSSAPPPPVSTSDLPPAVITSSTKISFGRPTPSWAAALVALGVFAGLVTAVLARGDGDALVHAGAQLVDPTHNQAAAVVAAAPIIQPTAVIAQTATAIPTPMTPVAVKPAACAEDKVEAKVETKVVEPKVETKPEPVVAKAAPPPVVQPPPVVKQAAVVAAPPKVVVAKAQPKVDAPAAAPQPKVAAKAAPKDDAAAANALAQAQLEAALGR